MISNELAKKHLISVTNGLKVFDRVFNKRSINYRVLGSVLVAALNITPHRTLGDIDVLVDKDDYEKVVSGLQASGYTIENKQKYGFKWTEAHHNSALGFTFLLIGKFSNDFFSCQLTRNIELRISANYLKPTNYSLHGINFIGIPRRSIYEGLKISSLNPKRTLDKRIVMNSFQQTIPQGDTLDESFKIFFNGVEFPHAYIIFSQLYNFYGGLRVLLGKKYEVWD